MPSTPTSSSPASTSSPLTAAATTGSNCFFPHGKASSSEKAGANGDVDVDDNEEEEDEDDDVEMRGEEQEEQEEQEDDEEAEEEEEGSQDPQNRPVGQGKASRHASGGNAANARRQNNTMAPSHASRSDYDFQPQRQTCKEAEIPCSACTLSLSLNAHTRSFTHTQLCGSLRRLYDLITNLLLKRLLKQGKKSSIFNFHQLVGHVHFSE